MLQMRVSLDGCKTHRAHLQHILFRVRQLLSDQLPHACVSCQFIHPAHDLLWISKQCVVVLIVHNFDNHVSHLSRSSLLLMAYENHDRYPSFNHFGLLLNIMIIKKCHLESVRTDEKETLDQDRDSGASLVPHLQQSGVGVRIPSCPEALKRPSSHVGAFFASDMRMAGCVGVSSETPVSSGTGNANLAQPATFLIRISGGRHLSFSLRSLTMNTRKSNNARTTSFPGIIPAIKKILARNEFNRLVTAPLGVNRVVKVEVLS
ncbi:MAG: hypothetical protein HQL97_01160 [Magnetococcales bacterium]|nr:hypothetical protein [Magnetococcales bacterium]